jgi:DNA-binding response OmpR family regulator
LNHKDHRSVGALLAVDSPELQAQLIDALAGVEIPAPKIATSARQLHEILAASNLDLIVMNSEIGGAYVAPMITEIRRGRLGPHPFPIVVVLVRDADPAAIRQVSNCGPDDIVVLPCEPQDLLDRINVFLAGARRPLVVNDGYAGPERRNKPRE